jgi:hypothetical protein
MPMDERAIILMVAIVTVLVGAGVGADAAHADNGSATSPTHSDVVNQANAPISSFFQIGLQDAYAPAPSYAITFGFALLYPNFWGAPAGPTARSNRRSAKYS